MIRAFITLTAAALITAVLTPLTVPLGGILPARWWFNPILFTWARVITAAAGIRLSVQGASNLRRGTHYFFAGNHQSALDIPVLIVALGGRVRFLAKEGLFKIPLMGASMAATGFVPVHREEPRKFKASLDRMFDRLHKKPISMAIFPEGSRTPDGRLQSFRRGAMQILQRSGLPITPFAIDGALDVHRAHTFHVRSGPVRISFGRPITADAARVLDQDQLSENLRDEIARLLSSPASPASVPAPDRGLVSRGAA